MSFSVFGRTDAICSFKDFRKIVIIGNPTKCGNFVDGKACGRKQFASVFQPVFFNIIGRGTRKVFSENAVYFTV